MQHWAALFFFFYKMCKEKKVDIFNLLSIYVIHILLISAQLPAYLLNVKVRKSPTARD